MSAFAGFADMDDLGATVAVEAPIVAAARMFTCGKCRGSGDTRWGPCFSCKGEGQLSAERVKRVAAWRRGEDTKAANKAERFKTWIEENHAMHEWMQVASARGFDFAGKMLTAVHEWGTLTEGQLAAVERCMTADAERATRRVTERAEREAAAPNLGEGASKIHAAMDKAKAAGLKRIKMRAGEIHFTRAPDTGRNAGHAYVKRHGLYIGKIAPDGRFIASRDCDAEAQAKVLEVAADPYAAMVAHGKETGTCGLCGRELTDPASIEAGIGPICAENYF